MRLGYENIEEMLDECSDKHYNLNDWEVDFIRSLKFEYLDKRDLTDRQEYILVKIHNKI